MAAKTKQVESLEIQEVTKSWLTACVLGSTPFILNRISRKVMEELLYPKGRKSTADKKNFLKHDPLQEYRASPYCSKDDDAPTRLLARGACFVEAMRSVALDVPGTNRTEMKRNTSVSEEYVHLYGIPKLMMSPVRCADFNKTPDIRTRAVVPEWACFVTVGCVTPIMSIHTVAKLLAAAGIMRGVGDWRVEKGGTFGQFEIVDEDDPRFVSLVQNGGRLPQDAALKTPDFYDEESRELFEWFCVEKRRRKEVKAVA